MKIRSLVDNARLRIALFAFAALVAYYPAMSGPFMLDDALYIANNVRVHSLENIASLFYHIQGPISHRPLVLATFALNYAFDGVNTTDYHLINVLLHISISLLLYEILRTSASLMNFPPARARVVSFFAVMLFLLHPIQTESVSYITSRSVLLVSLCYLSAMLLYIRMVQKGASLVRYALMFVIGMLGGASRENFITILAMLPLYDYLFLSKRTLRRTAGNLRFLIPLLPGIAYMLWMVSVTDAYFDTVGAGIAEVTPWMYFMTQWKVHWLYLRLIFFPVGQTLEHYVPFVGSFSLSLIPYAMMYFGLWGGSLWLLHRRSPAGYGLLWFMVTLTPTSSIVPIVDAAFEHRLYIPNMGLFALFSFIIFSLTSHKEEGNSLRTPVLILSALALLLSGATYTRNIIWGNALLMNQESLRNSPLKFRSWRNLAKEYYNLGNYEQAITTFKGALEIDPDDATTYYYLAMATLKAGNLTEAKQHFITYADALPDTPEADEARYNIGLIELKTEHPEEAVKAFEKALAHDTFNAASHNNLAVALKMLDRRAEAIEHYRAALSIAPDHPTALLNLGRLLIEEGNKSEGEAFLIKYSLIPRKTVTEKD